MHEVSVVSDIVSAILRELENYNVEKVEEVILVVGEMSGACITPDITPAIPNRAKFFSGT